MLSPRSGLAGALRNESEVYWSLMNADNGLPDPTLKVALTVGGTVYSSALCHVSYTTTRDFPAV